jgi:hypothetical protein
MHLKSYSTTTEILCQKTAFLKLLCTALGASGPDEIYGTQKTYFYTKNNHWLLQTTRLIFSDFGVFTAPLSYCKIG